MHTAAYLHNILPSRLLNYRSPTSALYLKEPTYSHLRVFGCVCYPNLSAKQRHKLDPRSTPCVFLGYPSENRGYRCLSLSTGKIILSRHVTFDESIFPFASSFTVNPRTYDFLTTHDHDLPSHLMTEFGHNPSPPPANTIPPLVPHLPIPPSDRAHQNTPNTQPATPPTIAPPPPTPPAPSPAPRPPRPAPIPTHGMTTRAMNGIFCPKALTASTHPDLSPIPKSPHLALRDPNWNAAMQAEFQALQENHTWDLVPRPSDASVIRCMWLFRHKFRSDGSLERYKARLVANGKTQQVGIDCDETFSPVIKPTTIRTVLSLAVSRSWPIHQLDVKNAFLHGDLAKPVYMHQPPGFVDSTTPTHVCRLRKSLYGLKQAPRAWYQRFATFVLSRGFRRSVCDTSLFIFHHGAETAYLLLYVDDIVLTASSTVLVRRIIDDLSREFSMTDLGLLHHFLGITVSRNAAGLFLSQQQYASAILARAKMSTCNPTTTPVDIGSKLSATAGPLLEDPTMYRSLAGALQYLTITRPDISYAVQQVCLFMHAPREPHLQFLKRILRYVRGTIDHGLTLTATRAHTLTAYSDADWAGCPDSRRSTSGYCVFLGDNLVSWSSKRQQTVSRSSAEAEYRAVANAVAETSWLRNLLLELHLPIKQATLVYCDNVSAVYLSTNPVQHQRTKHVELDIHFVREKVQVGTVRVLHVPSEFQYADIFTKGLPRHLFTRFRSSLSVRRPPAPTAGEY